ncbi:aminopeptidase N-like [Leptopilina boulardi]|uniref:aminopeptidase N-like n=1 Tax=Leptopilina boulardi TaxID=63433 RepID=UPI0021F5EF23|nr:aminopeptidase N-like [Leptopilina boulardi]
MNNYLKIYLLFILVQLSYQIKKKLPNNARPSHYELKFLPPLNSQMNSFIGESKIFLQVFEKTVNLTLHSFNLGLNEKSTKLTRNGEDLKPQNHFFDKESQFLILNFKNEIEPGNYILYLKFTGELADEVVDSRYFGFFRPNYKNNIVMTTHFNTLRARQTFPCWDEPEIKATFTIWVKRSLKNNAYSNMPLERMVVEINSNGFTWVVFKKSPLMSANKVCIIIADLQPEEHNEENTLSVLFTEDSNIMSNLTLQHGEQIISLFEKHIGIKYDMQKMQLFEILDKNAKPMGTCGLIMTSEHTVPTGENMENDKEVKPFLYLIYELARQWFGCLISAATPSDSWITEGLTFYISHFILGKMKKFSNYVEYIRYRSSIYALYMDVNIYNEPTAQEGSLVNYNIKAEAIMNMISGILTEDVFFTVIKTLLESYKYKTITTNNFWNIIHKEMRNTKLAKNNFNIRTYVEPYIVKQGYPTIFVKRDYGCNTIRMSQRIIIESIYSIYQKWWIPISIAQSSTINFGMTSLINWMNPHDEKLIIDGLNYDDWWYIVNVKSIGLYRVNYDERNWKRLVDYLNSEKFENIHVLNRMKIVDDALYFNKTKEISPNVIRGIEQYIYSKKDIVAEMISRDYLELLD